MHPTKKNILALALYAGEIMLKNGAETYRVEDTIIRICQAYNINRVESFVTPTGIFVSVDDQNNGDEAISFLKRIKNRTIDLNKISKINDFSRTIAISHLSTDEGMKILRDIDALPKYNKYLKTLCAGITSAFLGILLGATITDAITSFFVSILVYIFVTFVDNLNSNVFIQNASGGAMASLLAILAVHLNIGVNLDKIIISSIMILVPGVAITNAIRDSISGDFLSGLARAAEAAIIAIAIAVGAGTVMNTWIQIFGGVR
ncbi:threonine/serine exporter family protein [Clostridiaceae bacterium 35-E11]